MNGTADGGRSATMGDVARLAGVSQMTVSRVLNGSSAVRPATRERVQAAIRQLGYRPNSAARTLVTRRSRTLGVVGFDADLYGPAQMLHAIAHAGRDAGYFVTVASRDESDDPEALALALERLAEQSVDGLVVIAPLAGMADALADIAPQVPCVVALAGTDPAFPSIALNQVEGARLATRHLLERGAATVWHVCGPQTFIDASERVRGWRAELADWGAPVPDLVVGDWSAASGYRAGKELLLREEVEAVFVGNDPMALGLMRAMAEVGRRAPEDLLVVGYDDVPESAFYAPPLTTVRQDFAALGRRSIELLLAQLVDPAAPARAHMHAVVAPELVVRDTSTPGRSPRTARTAARRRPRATPTPPRTPPRKKVP